MIVLIHILSVRIEFIHYDAQIIGLDVCNPSVREISNRVRFVGVILVIHQRVVCKV